MIALLLNAVVGGWCLRSGVQSATDGEAWWAFGLAAAGVLNIGIAIAKSFQFEQVSR